MKNFHQKSDEMQKALSHLDEKSNKNLQELFKNIPEKEFEPRKFTEMPITDNQWKNLQNDPNTRHIACTHGRNQRKALIIDDPWSEEKTPEQLEFIKNLESMPDKDKRAYLTDYFAPKTKLDEIQPKPMKARWPNVDNRCPPPKKIFPTY